jgi:hypothetical protein
VTVQNKLVQNFISGPPIGHSQKNGAVLKFIKNVISYPIKMGLGVVWTGLARSRIGTSGGLL